MVLAHQEAQCTQKRAAQGLEVVHEPARCGHQYVDCSWLQPGRRIQRAASPCILGLQACQSACLCSQGVSPGRQAHGQVHCWAQSGKDMEHLPSAGRGWQVSCCGLINLWGKYQKMQKACKWSQQQPNVALGKLRHAAMQGVADQPLGCLPCVIGSTPMHRQH